ncbi:hypothetical protein NUW54_g6423 [Trametes sanguinea]|uniref:Uncharacterized protein n=1 Tax=Trametes sanguinea TaxID=158606 RepID=A0ACC1PTY9_9APHY|nr:hypothetical protein NUW54_g6423 [Trametes sanguinea]
MTDENELLNPFHPLSESSEVSEDAEYEPPGENDTTCNRHPCSCGCSALVTLWTDWQHRKRRRGTPGGAAGTALPRTTLPDQRKRRISEVDSVSPIGSPTKRVTGSSVLASGECTPEVSGGHSSPAVDASTALDTQTSSHSSALSPLPGSICPLTARWQSEAIYDGSSDSEDNEEALDELSEGYDTSDSGMSDGEGDLHDNITLGEAFEAEDASIDSHTLTALDLRILRALRLKTQDHLSDRTFERLPLVFGDSYLPSLTLCKRRLRVLSGFEPQIYDACVNSCISYAPEAYRSRNDCPYCGEPRYSPDGKSKSYLRYLPFTPRLLALLRNPRTAELLQYRARFTHCPDRITDFFDGEHYRNLIGHRVEVNGEQLGHDYFSDHRDIALALSTDGFAPFRKRQTTSWPLLLIVLNLPPELRTLVDYVLCLGEIRGPNKPKDWDSFFWPALMELIALAHGVEAFDGLSQSLFLFHAYLVLVFGDMPAMAMVMRMLGHTAKCPCRMCSIVGIRNPDKRKVTTHYVPLQPPGSAPSYDPQNLPLRNHRSFLETAETIQNAPNKAMRDRLRTESGIKGLPVLSVLGSISFPNSFPLDFMHLVFENTIPMLVKLWTGEYKDFPSNDDFVLAPSVWSAVSEAAASAKSTIPSAFGAPVPNLSKKHHPMTAEMWNVWATFLAPVLLRRRFTRDIYYRHFVLLVKLIKKCTQFEYTAADVSEIEHGFADWVQTFERLYYRRDPTRLACCTTIIHSLLHIVHGIRYAGPIWVYWAFVMERFCGRLLPAIKSRRFPWNNLDNYLEMDAILSHLRILYSLETELKLDPPRQVRRRLFTDPQYPSCTLVGPTRMSSLSYGQRTVIARCLMALFGRTVAQSRGVIPELVECWGELEISGGGDTISAYQIKKRAWDGRDKTFVRYQVYVDRHARNHHAEPEFEVRDFWGQLQNIFVLRLDIDRARIIGLEAPRTLILAEIKRCRVDSIDDLGNRYYRDPLGATEAVDLKAIQCVVGRVYDPARRRWAIIDRSGPFAEAAFSPLARGNTEREN